MSGFAFVPPPGPPPYDQPLAWLVGRQGRTAKAPICGGVATGDVWPGLAITEFMSSGPLGPPVAQATSLAQITGFSVEAESNVAGPPFLSGDDDWVMPAPYAIAGMAVLFVRLRSGAMVSVPCDASGVRPYDPVSWDFVTNQLIPAADGPALPVTVLHVREASVIQLFATIFVRWSAAMAGVAVILI